MMTTPDLRRLFTARHPRLAAAVSKSPAANAFWETVTEAFSTDLAQAETLQRDPTLASTREQRLLAVPLGAGETLAERVAVTLVDEWSWETTLAELEAIHPSDPARSGSAPIDRTS